MVDQPTGLGVSPEDNQIRPVKPKTKWWKLIPLIILVVSLVSAVAIVIYQNKSTETRKRAAAPAGNLISNGTFDTTVTRSISRVQPPLPDQPGGWDHGGGAWRDEYINVLTDTGTGNKFLRMMSRAGLASSDWLNNNKHLNLPAGEYTLKAQAKVLLKNGSGVLANATCAQTNCGTLNSNEPVSGSLLQFTNVVGVDGAWEEKQATFQIPVTGNYQINLFALDGSQAYWDNVELTENVVTPTPTPTGTLIPTNTPVPTNTPQPTPTTPPGGDTLTMKIRFQGIDEQGSDQLTRVVFKQGGQEVWTNDLTLTADNNGTYSITVDKPSELTAGDYEVFFKGRSHLQKQLPAIGQTVAIANGDTILDFAGGGLSLVLKAGDTMNVDGGGDLVFHDNKITLEDITAIVIARGNEFSVPVTAETVSLDINADGFITVQDIALAIMNWSDEIVQGDE